MRCGPAASHGPTVRPRMEQWWKDNRHINPLKAKRICFI
jgi:hypothetical protein